MGKVRGVTLIEVLFAIALVAVAVLALVGLNVTGLKQMAQGRNQVAAQDMAERVLDATKEVGFALIPDSGTFDGRLPTPPPAVGGFPPRPYPGQTINGEECRVWVSVSKVDTHLKNVEVRVYFGQRWVSLGRSYSN